MFTLTSDSFISCHDTQ